MAGITASGIGTLIVFLIVAVLLMLAGLYLVIQSVCAGMKEAPILGKLAVGAVCLVASIVLAVCVGCAL